jgi:hypothetical protein
MKNNSILNWLTPILVMAFIIMSVADGSYKTIEDYRMAQAKRVILDTYGDVVSVEAKKKDLRKWGRNENVGTSNTTIMTLPIGLSNESLVTTNTITTMVSSSASDTQLLDFYEGQTISGTDLTFRFEGTDNALTGQTGKALTTPVARITRARLKSPAVGTIYFYRGGATTGGVPDTLANVHMMISPGEIQSQKASTSISQFDYYIITGATATVLEKTASYAQVRIETKNVSDTYWYPITEWISATDASGSVDLLHGNDPYLIIPKNSDVRVNARANAANIDVSAGITGYLAIIQ